MTADDREKRKQAELEKRRDEERQVEELRKQMYLSGQGRASDVQSAASSHVPAQRLSGSARSEQKTAIDEQKRRRDLLRKEHETRDQALDGEGDASSCDDEDDALADTGERVLARSRYEEDVHVRGHSSVWGSWYSETDKLWGFKCCKSQDASAECPLQPEQPDEEPAKAMPRGKKRRRRGQNAAQEPEPPQGGLQGKAAADAAASGGAEAAPLIDERMLEAAERKKEQRRLEERSLEETKSSGYLADLLLDPTAP